MSQTDPRNGNFELIPIARADTYRTVVEQLTHFISSSGFQEGDRLPPERELSERLAVSRVLVREALRTLEAMGLLEVRRNKGRFVLHGGANLLPAAIRAQSGTGLALLNDLIDVRVAIEQRVVEIVGAQPNPDLRAVRAVLEHVQRDLETAGSDSKMEGGLDPRFEAALGRQTGNPLLHALQQSVHQVWIEACLDCGLAAGDRRSLHQEHVAILEALESGDAAKASRLTCEHLNRSVGGSVGARLPTNSSALAAPMERRDQSPP